MAPLAGRRAWMLGFVAAVGCAGDSPTEVTAGPPAAMLIVAGQDQSGEVGAELPTPLRVKVVDAEGRPVKGQVVNFRVTAGGGSMFLGATITSDSGTAVDRWTLGTSTTESQRVEARALDPETGTPLVATTFEATPRPAPPAKVSKVAGDAQAAEAGTPVSDSLAVKVVDRYDNPVPNVSVRWEVSAGGGSLGIPTASRTNAQGIARASWTLGSVRGAPQQVAASVDGVEPARFNASATGPRHGPPTVATVISGPLSTTVPTAVDFTVRLTDANAVPVPNHALNFVLTSGNGSLFQSGVVTSETGEATNRWSPGTSAGSHAIEVRGTDPVTGAPTVFGRFAATALPGPVTRIELRPELVPPRDVSVMFGRTVDMSSFVFRALDTYSNVVPTPTYNITAVPEGWTVQGPSATAPAQETVGSLRFVAGTGSATVKVLSVRDLRTVRLRASWACGYYASPALLISGVVVDSTTSAMNVDSVRTAADPGPRRGYPHYHDTSATPMPPGPPRRDVRYIMYASGTTTHHLRGGSTVTAAEQRDFMLVRQWHDSLLFQAAVKKDGSGDGTAPPESEMANYDHRHRTAVRIQANPLRFRSTGVGCTAYNHRERWWILEEY